MSSHPAVDLLEQVLRRLPKMPNALCRGRSELFDSEDPADVAAAVGLCRRCPEVDTCAAWASSLGTKNRPPGVVGGRFYRTRRPRGSVVGV